MSKAEVVSSELEADVQETAEEVYDHPYRAISRAAVISVILAPTGLFMMMFSYSMAAIPLAGIAFALTALSNIRRYPNEVLGKGLAKFGLASCIAAIVGSITLGVVTYASEVPEGYMRLTFSQLDLPKDKPVLTKEIQDLDGKRIFIRGYVHPGVADFGKVKQFVLVGDLGVCCFGGQPEPYDMIDVSFVNENAIRYSRKLRRIGGVLRLQRPKKTVGQIQSGYYKLEADYVK